MSGFSPVSFMFVAAGIATKARAMLYKMSPSRTNVAPDWSGRGDDLATVEISEPITDPSYWEGRFVLTTLNIIRPDDPEPLVINDATVTISLKKEIVKTSLVGLDGSIKEYINNGDYDIRINVGIVAVENGRIVDEYPEEGIRRVKEFLLTNEALEVQSTFLDIFDINNMVVTDFSLKQETASNRQVIEIKALSDKDYTINCTEY